MADYNAKAVDDAIAASNRSGKRIGGKERKLIHALLQGRKPTPAKANPKRKRRKVTRVKKNPTFGKRKRVAGASIRRHFIIELLHKDYGVWYVNAVGKASINRKSANHFVAKADAERNMKSFLAHMPHNVKKNFVWIRTVPA
jgi:hypothetical protein